MKLEPKTIREIMPDDFTMTLAREIGCDPSNVSRVINLEKTTSKYWPAIEKLALKTDAKAYRERMKFLNQRTKVHA
jgi:hypothetical protein